MTESPPTLPVERTRLSWRRTTLAATSVVLVALSHVLIRGASPVATVAISLMATTWLALLTLAHTRIVALAQGMTQAPRRRPAMVGAVTAALAVLACLIVLG